MKVWRRMLICMAAVLLALVAAGGALGASVSGRASTQIEWFDNGEEDTAVPFYQYLLLNARDIDGKGLDFRGYGRLADDLNNEVKVDSRLYYAYLEKKNLVESLDLKLGRQFISTTAGASLMDGIYLDYRDLGYRDLGPYSLAFFFGGDVTYYEGYNAEDLIVGTELSGTFLDSLDLALSYLQKWEDGDLSHELIGFDFDYDHRRMFNLYSETQYSWLTDEVTYFLAGLQYHKDPLWSLRGEYLYSLPVFSSTSIYSVFAAEAYEEASLELDYKLDAGLRAFARYSHEFYEDFDDADVLEAGLEKLRTGRFSGYLTGTLREDSGGQDLLGFKARAAYLYNSLLEAGVGIHLDVLERRLEDDDETTNTRIWIYGTAYLNKKINVQAKVERIESDLWDDYYRGRVRLNVLF